LKFLDHALVLSGAVAGPLVGVEGAVKNIVHSAGLVAVQPPAFDGWEQLLERRYVRLGHLHVPTGEDGVQFRAAFLAPAILHDGFDGFIYPRRLRELRDLVAESLGVVF